MVNAAEYSPRAVAGIVETNGPRRGGGGGDGEDPVAVRESDEGEKLKGERVEREFDRSGGSGQGVEDGERRSRGRGDGEAEEAVGRREEGGGAG